MFKIIRWTFTLIMVLVVGGVVAAQFISLNQFKGRAAAMVKEATGRDLEIAGDISVSFYPLLGAKLEKISLSNAQGATQPTMLSVEKIMVGVKIPPLITARKIELDKIILERPVVYLEKTSGKGNWEFAAKEGSGRAKNESGDGSAAGAAAVLFNGIVLRDGTISYQDRSKGSAIELEQVHATLSMTALHAPVQLEASAVFNKQPVKLQLRTQNVEALRTAKGSTTVLEVEVAHIPVKLEGTFSLTPERVSIPDLVVSALQTQAKGKLNANLQGETPVVDAALHFGAVNLEPLVLLGGAAQLAAGGEGGGKQAAAVAKKERYLDAGALAGVQGSVSLSADSLSTAEWELVKPQLKANIGGGAAATAMAGQFVPKNGAAIRYAFETVNVMALLSPEGGGFSANATGEGLKLQAGGTLSALPGKIALSGANITYNGMPVSGNAVLEEQGANQSLSADIRLASGGRNWQVQLRTPALNLLTTAEGAPLEVTAESGTEKFVIKTTLSSVNKVTKLNPLSLSTNGGAGKGYLLYDQQSALPLLTLNMDFAALDMNPLLAFAASQSGGSEGGTGDNATSASAGKKGNPFQAMNADVRLKAKELRVQNLDISKIDLTASLKEGVLKISLPDAGLYQGSASLEASVDGNRKEPGFAVDTRGNGVNIGSLLKAASGNTTFAGIGQWQSRFSGSGLETPSLYNTLQGEGNFAVQKGVVRGMDLFRLMSAVRGELGSTSLVRTTDETNNLNVTGSFQMASGVLRNNDLAVQSPNIEASGKGSISLPAWSIDYRLEPKIGERRKAGEGEKFVGQSVPVVIKGSLDKPSVGPDAKALVGQGIEILKTIKEGGIGEKVKGVEDVLKGITGGGAGSGNGNTAPNPGLDALKGLLGQ